MAKAMPHFRLWKKPTCSVESVRATEVGDDGAPRPPGAGALAKPQASTPSPLPKGEDRRWGVGRNRGAAGA